MAIPNAHKPKFNGSFKAGRTLRATFALGAIASLGLAGCSDSDSSGDKSGGSSSGDEVGVSLIVKNTLNPFFVSMQKSAEGEADKLGVRLTFAAGKEDGDEATQITAIENAIAAGDKGILITPNGPGVNDAITKAREAGLYVIALDTPPDPASIVDITYATDNFLAGQLICQWTDAQLGGKDATSAIHAPCSDKGVSVDLARDQGFLDGMGIEIPDETKNGSEAPTGNYASGKYEVVCHEATQGAEDGGRTAMETCLAANANMNDVYKSHDPAANGAYAALKAAGKEKDVLIVSVDGGCAGIDSVKNGIIGATAQQYPGKMATLGMAAIKDLADNGTKPEVTEGLDFFNTGVALVTDNEADGVDSISVAEGMDICWG